MTKAQTNVTVAIIGALGVVAVPFIAGRAGAQTQLSDLRGDIRVVEERENNHYAEVQKQLEEISTKLDKVLVQQR